MAGQLEGRVAIVTGAGRGIGAEIGARLAEDGAAVVVSGRDADRLQGAVRNLEAQGAAALGIVADAASREDCERLVNAAREHFGRVDILVNNAGMTHDQLLVRMTDEDWDRVMEVNLRAAFLMTRAVTKALVRGKRGGRITSSGPRGGSATVAASRWIVSSTPCARVSRGRGRQRSCARRREQCQPGSARRRLPLPST